MSHSVAAKLGNCMLRRTNLLFDATRYIRDERR